VNLSTDPYVWIAAILSLSVFSFLYEDNPLFCLAEHLLVGLSTGYIICTYWHNVFVPELIRPLMNSGFGENAHLWGAAVLCLFWAARYVEKLEDFYRFALAFWVSIDMGMTIPTFMESQVLAQVAGTMDVSFQGSLATAAGNAILVLGTIAALAYFFFSRPHEGVLGKVAQGGVLIIMVGFGATFSYTIMSRVYVLIGCIQFLLRDWLGIIG
jgi:hypothetical protein